MDIIDFKVYGLKNFRGYRYILVFIDTSSKNGWTVSLKIEYAQTRIDSLQNILNFSKTKVNLLETNDGKEFVTENFTGFPNKK